jgi:two-component system, LytTR family, sensor kinase
METGFKRDLRNYPLYFVLWTILGLFYFSQGITQRLISHDPTPWWRYLLAWLLGVYIWAILTPIILWLGRRFPLERGNWLPQVIRHFFLSAGFSAFELALETVLYLRLHLFPSSSSGLRGAIGYALIRGFHGGVLNYWTVLGVQWGVVYYRRYRERSEDVLKVELRASELQSQLISAQLNALKTQLQPHFLFNTLNAITVLVRQQKTKDAEQMLGHLSDLLRVVLEDMSAQEVSLRRELDYLQLYLAIEQVRFQDRLRVQLLIDPVTQEALVPQMILQPIVENAVRHGIGRSSSAGRVLISASKIDDAVELRVEDDGPGLSSGESSNDRGIGLANTRARLQQLYGQDARLEIGNCEQRGVVVTMTIPFHQSHAETLKTYDLNNANHR